MAVEISRNLYVNGTYIAPTFGCTLYGAFSFYYINISTILFSFNFHYIDITSVLSLLQTQNERQSIADDTQTHDFVEHILHVQL